MSLSYLLFDHYLAQVLALVHCTTIVSDGVERLVVRRLAHHVGSSWTLTGRATFGCAQSVLV